MTKERVDGPSLSSGPAARRQEYLRLDRIADAEVEALHAHVDSHIDVILDAFYRHLEKFDALKPHLEDEAKQRRLKALQRVYLSSLGLGRSDAPYFEQRLQIGRKHEEIGLDIDWYIGAYAVLFDVIAEGLPDPSLLMTLHKLFVYDMTIVAQSYHDAAIERLERLLRQLEETQIRLEQSLRTDVLTGVGTRRFLFEALQLELYRSKRFNHPFTLLLFDLDNFKYVNDNHGHAFGDHVLREIAQIARDTVRPANLVARYGGEEFVIGLVECDTEAAIHVAERLRLRVAHQPIAQGDHSVSITISVGVAGYEPDSDTVETLIENADKAMYRAKTAGRNRVCVHGPDPRKMRSV